MNRIKLSEEKIDRLTKLIIHGDMKLIAKKAGVSSATVSRFFQKKFPPTIKLANAVVDVLGERDREHKRVMSKINAMGS